MDFLEKIAFMKGTNEKLLAGDTDAGVALSFDLMYSSDEIIAFILSTAKLLNTYCESVEAGKEDLTAFYIDACRILDRPVDLGVSFS